ncbi:CPBP family intramembrane glutamic endopeptidase [Clostridium neuense]|uniref:CPBP family intramembrane glutamic endopeptidase n=1 Tax=Clostridium neuense TaxID=1728934 RepID=A0ABW8TEB6_9CLOT
MIKRYIKNHEILSFIFLTFLFSWTIWVMLYISSKNWAMLEIINTLGAFGPGIMSIILTGFLYKKKGLKALLTRLTKWRYNLIYYIIAVFYWIASIYIFYLICKFFGSKGKVTFINTKPYYILGGFIYTLLLGGPLGEEIGWRGFLLPRLQKRLNPFYSSIVLGIIWSCWHLPLFFIAGTCQYGIPFFVFIMVGIINTIIITWIFNRTNGSLIFPILFHTCINMTWLGLLVGAEAFAITNIYKFSIVQVVIMIFVVRDMFKNSKYGRVTVDNGDIVVIGENK